MIQTPPFASTSQTHARIFTRLALFAPDVASGMDSLKMRHGSWLQALMVSNQKVVSSITLSA